MPDRLQPARLALAVTVFLLFAARPVLAGPALPPAWPARTEVELAHARLAWLQILVNDAGRVRSLAAEAERVAVATARDDRARVAFQARLAPRDEALVRAWIEPWWMTAGYRAPLGARLADIGRRGARWAGGHGGGAFR